MDRVSQVERKMELFLQRQLQRESQERALSEQVEPCALSSACDHVDWLASNDASDALPTVRRRLLDIRSSLLRMSRSSHSTKRSTCLDKEEQLGKPFLAL